MPLEPVSKTQPMPVDTAERVRELVDLTAAIGRGDTKPDLTVFETYRQMQEMAATHPDPNFLKQWEDSGTDLYLRGVADHFCYLGATNPELFRALQHEAVMLSNEELSAFQLGFHEWLYLLQGASDDCVETLVAKLQEKPSDWDRLNMLAAIMTPAALDALAHHARANNAVETCEDSGFEIPADVGPAVPRFFVTRSAVRIASDAEADTAKHMIGLSIASISDGNQPEITWHYLTLDLSDIPGLPTLPFQKLHLVSPESNRHWTLACRVSDNDRYAVISIEGDRDDNQVYAPEPTPSRAVLLPFDDRLTYTNGHIFSTEGVYAVVGGPPIGLYPNPKCPECGRLVLHLCTAQSYIHEYGEGFRCLYVCEDCHIATCTGVGWN